MNHDLAKLMKERMLSKTAFLPPLMIPLSQLLMSAGVSAYLAQLLYKLHNSNPNATTDDLIESMDLADGEKEELRASIEKMYSDAANKGYDLTSEDLLFYINNYAEEMRATRVADKESSEYKFDIDKLLSTDSDYDEDDSEEHEIHFAKVSSTSKMK